MLRRDMMYRTGEDNPFIAELIRKKIQDDLATARPSNWAGNETPSALLPNPAMSDPPVAAPELIPPVAGRPRRVPPLVATEAIPVSDMLLPPPVERLVDSYADQFGAQLERPREVRRDREGNKVAPYMTDLEEAEMYRENVASQPVKSMGFWKRLGIGMLMGLGKADPRGGIGGMLGSALGGGAVSAAMPMGAANLQRQQELGTLDADVARQQGIQDTQIKREGDLAKIDLTRAQADYTRERPELAREALQQKREVALQKAEFDKWRMQSGDRKQDSYESWLEWRKENGDATLKTRQEYYEWQRAADEARQQDRDLDRALRMSEGAANRATRVSEGELNRGQRAKYSRAAARARLAAAGLSEAQIEAELNR